MRTKEMNFLIIGQLAERAGAGVETIRFYKCKGLIAEPRGGLKMLRRASALLALLFAAGFGGAELRVIAAGDAAAQEAPQVQEVRTITVTVLGMSCPFCAYGLHKKLLQLGNVEVKLKEGLAILTLEEDTTDIPDETIEKLVDEAGFEATKIERSFEIEQKAAKVN